MATGQTTFSTSKQQVDRGFKPYPPGEYEWALDVARVEIRQKQEEGAIPYVNISAKLQNETREDGTPAKFTLFHRFFLNLDPGSDGTLMPNRKDGLVAFARAVGQDVDVPLVKMTKKMKSGDLKTIDVLDPKEVVAWLKSLDGVTFRARIKTEKGTGGYEDKSVIDSFIAVEGGHEPSPVEDEEVNTGEAIEEAVEEAPEEPEEAIEAEPEEVFDPVPVPKKAAPKSAAKAAPKPAPRVVTRRK